MSSEWIDIKSAVRSATVYIEGTQVAKDVSITLPEVTHQTVEINAMGPLTLPLMGLTDNLEATITTIGLDLGFMQSVTPVTKKIEVRWAQNVVKADGELALEGCKAFLTAVPQGIPSVSVKPGETYEGELKYTVFRYELYIAGEEALVIDKLNHILKVNGKDYYPQIDDLL